MAVSSANDRREALDIAVVAQDPRWKDGGGRQLNASLDQHAVWLEIRACGAQAGKHQAVTGESKVWCDQSLFSRHPDCGRWAQAMRG